MKTDKKNYTILLILLLFVMLAGCSRLRQLEKERPRVNVALPTVAQQVAPATQQNDTVRKLPEKIIFMRADGQKVPINVSAEWDSAHNENITSVALDEVIISAQTKRNIAERSGKVNVEFIVAVPEALQSKNWMLNVQPVMMKGEVIDSLNEIRFTGERFRSKQLEDYTKFNKYLSEIIPDTADFYRTFVDYASFEKKLAYLDNRRVELRTEWGSLEDLRLNPLPFKQRMERFESDMKQRDSLGRLNTLREANEIHAGLEKKAYEAWRKMVKDSIEKSIKDSLFAVNKVLTEDYERGKKFHAYKYFEEKDFDKSDKMRFQFYGERSVKHSQQSDAPEEKSIWKSIWKAKDKKEKKPVEMKFFGGLPVDKNEVKNEEKQEFVQLASPTELEQMAALWDKTHIKRNESYEPEFTDEKQGGPSPLQTMMNWEKFQFINIDQRVAQARVNQRHYSADSVFTVHMTRYRSSFENSYRTLKTREHDNISMEIRNNLLRQEEITAQIGKIEAIDSLELVRDYYKTNKIERNQKMVAGKDEKFKDMVRFPFNPLAHLDTVIHANGKVFYHYVEKIQADENTARLKVFLRGELVSRRGAKYQLPPSDTLTYFVSSMTKFIDYTPRYVQRVVNRDAEANASVQLSFQRNKTKLDPDLGDNRKELKRVRTLTRELMTDPVFIIDSLSLTANSSPEGTWHINDRLAKERAYSVKEVMEQEFKELRDSLIVSSAMSIDEHGNVTTVQNESHLPDLPKLLRVYWLAEDWNRLSSLVNEDEKVVNKDKIIELIGKEKNPDRREVMLRKRYPKDYAYIRETLYPALRMVDFRFNLHRRGMLKDTIHTTELDTAYARGVELLEKRRYEDALEILRSYEDRNTTLTYMSLGYDDAALRICATLPEDDEVCYLLAILYARKADEKQAVQKLLRACELSPMLKYRGNLDPELSMLIKKYGLFNEEE